MCAPGSVSPHTRFRARVYLLSAAEGGRHTGIGTAYRPQFHIRTTDVVGTIELDGGGSGVGDGVEGVAARAFPGDTVELTVQLGAPVALHDGLGFAIREGGHTVGAGTVTALLD